MFLAVFAAILLSAVFESPLRSADISDETTVIHANEYSGQAPSEAISRTFADNSSFTNRVAHDFDLVTLEALHSHSDHTSFTQTNSYLAQVTTNIKVYKKLRQFLI